MEISTDPGDTGATTPDLLRQLEWRVQRAVQTMLSGNYRSAFRGRGMEFDQVVKYTWGDDVRDLDWNVSARLGELYRKRFIEEREVSVLLVFEDTPSLQFGSVNRTRRETLLELAALLILLAATNRDRVGLLYTSPLGFWYRRPLPGRTYARRTAAMLLGETAPPLDGAVTAAIPWRLALRSVSAHSVLVWLGAFDAGAPPSEWPLLCRRYQTLGGRADDPWDEALPKNTRLTAFDPLAGQVLTLHPGERERTEHARWQRERDDYLASLFPDPRDRLLAPNASPVFQTMVDFFNSHQASAQRRGAGATS